MGSLTSVPRQPESPGEDGRYHEIHREMSHMRDNSQLAAVLLYFTYLHKALLIATFTIEEVACFYYLLD